LPVTKKLSLRVFPLVLGVAIVSACAAPIPSTTDTPAVPSAAQSSPAPTTVQTATATPTDDKYSNLSPDLITIEKQAIVDAVNTDGYKAKFSVTWHKVTELQAGDFSWFSNCLSKPPNFSPEAPQRRAVRGAVVSVFAEFPNADGFVWPKNQPVSVSVGGDGSVGVDGTFVCTEESYPALDGKGVQLSPGVREQVNFLVYEQEDITPKNPTGAFPAEDPPVYTVFIGGRTLDCGSTAKCRVSNEL
jgi:hypothetical protein